MFNINICPNLGNYCYTTNKLEVKYLGVLDVSNTASVQLGTEMGLLLFTFADYISLLLLLLLNLTSGLRLNS